MRAALLVAALLLALAPASAVAQPASVSGPVTDAAGVLSAGDEAAVERAIAEGRRDGVDLHVLFVGDTGGAPVTAYARDVASASSMGGDDALLVVAFGDRTYAIWTGESLEVDDREIEAVLDRFVAPPLRAGDVAAAVEAAVSGLVRAHAEPGVATRDPGRSTGGGVPWMLIVLLGIGALFLVSMFRRARAGGGGGDEYYEPAPEADIEALAAEANAALVRVDDKLRDAEHEAGFAEAQFGKEEASALSAGLERARSELQQAFTLRQQLDDHVPEPPGQQVAMLQRITAHASEAESVIQQRLDRLEELRGLERDPAGALAELRARRERVAQRIPAVQAAAAELRASAPSVVSAVEGNVTEAEKRLAFASERITEAEGSEPAAAAQALRAGGAALAQAEQLLDAVEDLGGRVQHARQALPQELQEAELALARAEDLVRSRRHVVGREARTRLAEAQRRFDEAQSLASRDPAGAAAHADAAERLADEAFDLAWHDSEDPGDGAATYGGGFGGFGWGMPMPIPIPFPIGGGIGWGGTSWGGGLGGGLGGLGGAVGGGGFGGGSVGGGRW